ncbi:MAG TPA: dihydrodipicolinate synthase family protein [Bryobacteraceae bacterium]|nr:dihydrodipicolinate synthase family protein [Bryobacteraceae bacterium]
MKITLPTAQRRLIQYELANPAIVIPTAGPTPRSRFLYAAAHVVSDPLADVSPAETPCLDWEATLAFRRHLWSCGLSVAEAMDTAQRGSGLDWAASQELIRRSLSEARAAGGGIACGAGTDHLSASGATITAVQSAYEEQCAFVEGLGGRVILMASRALAACAHGADDYRRVYGNILRQVSQPVILHWLGEAFDPSLAGYWGTHDIIEAMETCLGIIAENRPNVEGIKISLLDPQYEIAMRRRLPSGVRMYTGDDFHYDTLILGDEEGHSDALLGIFDPLAAIAASAVRALDEGDAATYRKLLAPTVPLSRHLFRKPTYFYKTGIVFLAYLNGHQRHFRMVGAQEGARSIVHLAELFMLADRAGLFVDPELALKRMHHALALAGIE